MNERWICIETGIRTVNGKCFRSYVAEDRLGFRVKVNGSIPLLDLPEHKEEVTMKTNRLLLVEDSDDDASLFLRTVNRSGLAVVVSRARNIPEARRLLLEATPSLVTLDCNLLGATGLEFLREMRANAAFCRIPVVMMSGTDSDFDVGLAYSIGANSFLRKPPSFESYSRSIQLLLDYWFGIHCSSLPARCAPASVWVG